MSRKHLFQHIVKRCIREGLRNFHGVGYIVLFMHKRISRLRFQILQNFQNRLVLVLSSNSLLPG